MKASIYNSTALSKAFDCRSTATTKLTMFYVGALFYSLRKRKAVILSLVVRAVCVDVLLFILRVFLNE
jgi:hypothetical protein